MKFCIGLALTSIALAAPPELTLRDAVAQALATHPLLAAGAERISAAEGLRAQAGLRPNPRIYLQTENLRAHGTPGFNFAEQADTYAYFAQPFETAGKRDRRVEAAAASVRRAELERELLTRQIASRVKMAYWNAVVAQRSQDLLRENLDTFRQIVAYHEIRVKAGAMAEADLLRVRLEADRLTIGANSAALEAERARIQLFREMGQAQFPEVRLAEPLEEVSAQPPMADPERAMETRTELKLARAAVEQALATVRLQKAAATPDIEAIVGYKRTQGFNTMLGGVQLNLPVRDRNQGNIAAAEREVKAAEANLAATEALVRAEVTGASRDFEMRRAIVLRSLPPLREQAEESSRISLAAYREGGSDLLRLLDAERVRIETNLLHIRTLAEFQQSKVALETALGMEP